MTINGQVSVTPLLNWVAIGFEVPLALPEVAVIGLSFSLIITLGELQYFEQRVI